MEEQQRRRNRWGHGSFGPGLLCDEIGRCIMQNWRTPPNARPNSAFYRDAAPLSSTNRPTHPPPPPQPQQQEDEEGTSEPFQRGGCVCVCVPVAAAAVVCGARVCGGRRADEDPS